MAIRAALVGSGNMASYIVDSALARNLGAVSIQAIVGVPEAEESLSQLAEKAGCPWTYNLWDIDLDNIDLVIETASQAFVIKNLPRLLRHGKDVLVMSVGALSDAAFLREVDAAARSTGAKVHLPSGAIGGLDALKSASLAGLASVTLITRKPPASLEGAPYLEAHGIDLQGLTVEREIFTGNAIEASTAFPNNLNVATLVSLVGVGPEQTRVRVVADPNLENNVHEIQAQGAFGSMRLQFANAPSPQNPKTSYLAVLSAVRLLRDMGSPLAGLT